MADTKISNMTAASALGGTELVAGVQSGSNVKITAAQIKTFTSASPTLVTPTLGVASATTINRVTLTAPASGSTLTIADGKTLTASATMTLQGGDASVLSISASKTVTHSATTTFAGTDGKTLTISNSLTLAGTDATVMTFPSTSATIARTDAANSFVGVQTVASSTATPAAGSTAARLLFGTTAGFGIYYGSGAPTVVAGQGSLYLRSDGSTAITRAYIATDGSGTWTAISTVL